MNKAQIVQATDEDTIPFEDEDDDTDRDEDDDEDDEDDEDEDEFDEELAIARHAAA